MHSIIKALGTVYTSEKSETLLTIDRPPFGKDVREIITNTKLVVKRRRKTIKARLFFFQTFEESFHIDYFVVHYLKVGGYSSYTRRIHAANQMEAEVMEGLYLESIDVVKANLIEDSKCPSGCC